MVWGKLKVKLLKRQLKQEEKLQERRSKAIKAKFAKEKKLAAEKAKIAKMESELKAKIKKAREKGLTKSEIEFFKKRKEFIENQKKELKDKLKVIGKETGNILKTFAVGIAKTIEEQERISKRPVKKQPCKRKTKKKTTKKTAKKKKTTQKRSKK
jgi:hypothetical protein